ncbi:hypothetical protein LA080_015070 [Diaporthe eres]|nr:hypothetical protein LA080_015070 [Diaporthe eres]
MARTPRFDPYERLIYRFFEAIYLLSLLGNTRGPHVATVFEPWSLISVRRRFLKNLAALCDDVKGGESTASIAVQDRPDHFVFWISSNIGPPDRVLVFLRSMLEEVKSFVRSTQDDRRDVENDLTRKCVEFALKRMRSQAHSLVNCAQRCRNYLLENLTDDQSENPLWTGCHLQVTDNNTGNSLAEWLLQFKHVKFQEEGLHQICQDAYRVRNDPEMLAIERLGQRFHNATHPESISVAFSRVRHIIGRLAAHIRSVKQLLDDGIHVDDLLEAYEVSAVPVPPSVPQPPADDQTSLRGIMTRILPLGSNDPRFEGLLGYLSHIDQQAHLEDKLSDFHSPDRKAPTVHAEVQMLHHFYDNRLAFAGADRYIAASKPACLCCKLYFRHHPAMCVEPDSHQRVWPSWGPVLLPLGRAEPSWTEQRDVLISVSRDIRKEVILVIEQRQAISFAHPDSLTGITYTMDVELSELENGQWDDDDEDLDSDSGFNGGVQL